MVLTADGQVLTNYHVVEGSSSIKVTLADGGRTYTATVVGHDAQRDVALLQLNGASGLATVTPDNDTLTVGAAVTMVGNANGQGYLSAASGVVTDTSSTVTVADEANVTGSETLTGVIQTNAAAVPGDSGGPTFDAEGEVTGMTTAGSQTLGRRGRGAVTTTSFAVPIDTAMKVIEQIRSGKESGTVEIGGRPYLGVILTGDGSTQVETVPTGTAAASAGVKAGATITSIAGEKTTTQAALKAVLDGLDAGQSVAVTWTDAAGTSHRATVKLGTNPQN